MCKYVLILFWVLLEVCSVGYAQSVEKSGEEDGADKYSHWTAGISIGEPFVFCNLTSFAARKTYWGVSFGAFGGYQFNPVLGISLSLDYGMNKAGAHSYALDRKLGPDGTTYYLPTLPGTPFSEIYSQVRFFNIGIQTAFNLNRILFQPENPQRFTVLLQPAVYMQHFRATVYSQQKRKVTDGSLNGGPDFGLGADLALRGRINSRFDMQLSSGIIWTTNNTFDGVDNLSKAKDDFLWSTKISLIYKINRKSKREKDNILYAPVRRSAVASAELSALLAKAEEREKNEKELMARLIVLLEKQNRDTTTVVKVERVVDTLYIVQKEAPPVLPAGSPDDHEEWVMRLMNKIRTEQPDIIEEVGFDTLVRQAIQAREEYAGYFTDDNVPAEIRQNATPKYAIQIYAMTNPFPVAFFKDTPGIRVVRLVKDRLYRYLYAVYDSKEEARAFLPEVQKKYWDAFIREFDDYMIKNALILDYSANPAKVEKR